MEPVRQRQLETSLQEGYDPSPLEEEVLHAVKNERCSRVTTQYLSDRTGLNEQDVEQALANLAGAGWLYELAPQFYELVHDPRATPRINNAGLVTPRNGSEGMEASGDAFDADLIEIEGGTQDDEPTFKNMVKDLELKFSDSVPVAVVIDHAVEEHDWSEEDAESTLENLKRRGEVYAPKDDHIRTT